MKYDVFYSPFQYFEENTVELEDKNSHSDFYYSQCPVWGHMFDRTFVGYSPADFKLRYFDNVIEYQINDEEIVEIDLDEVDEEYSDENILFHMNDMGEDFQVIQLVFISSFFWAPYEQEYLWFEFLDHPHTFATNNFVTVGGWFNLANHPRSTSLAIKYEADSDGIVIEKGDPLYRVRFYTENMDDKPNLVKKKASKNMSTAMDKRREVMSGDRKFMKEVLFDKNLRGQCPYH
tara:strand:+ start:150 stop:848 length:699 start_codon:yes stop_codon:yes gene_type:complete